jgi:tRNA A-37 threonylcarbamoyl transferase component Bud32
MKPRSFNTIEIDAERGVVRKSSTNLKKLEGEILFYVNSPDKVKALMPDLYEYAPDYSWYEMEYINRETLTEVVNKSELSLEEWTSLFSSIYETLDWSEGGTNYSYIYDVFTHKALIRAETVDNKELRDIFFEGCTVNGKKLDPLYKLLVRRSGIFFKVTKAVGVLHGDLCFSNILVSRDNLNDLKLIDPRGGFDVPSTKGPVIYDFAKLAQSVYSWYDKIVEGQYSLTRSGEVYLLSPLGHLWGNLAAQGFSDTVEKFNLSEDEARLLGGIMLSGAPGLHLDDQDRAVALALNAALLLS